MSDSTCPAMTRAKITDPNSQDGIDFCVDSCPYKRCIVVENSREQDTIRAKQLQKKGMSISEISTAIGKSTSTVRRYLK